MEDAVAAGSAVNTPAEQQQQQSNDHEQQGASTLEQSLQAVLGIQANQQHTYTGSGLVTARATESDYERAVEQGQLAVQSQLHFTYPESKSILNRAHSKLFLTPPSKQNPQAGALPSPQSDDEHTTGRRSRGRSLFDRFSPSSPKGVSPAVGSSPSKAAKPADKAAGRSRSPPKQAPQQVEIAFGRRWPERSRPRASPAASHSSPGSKRASATDSAEPGSARASQDERMSTMDRLKRFMSPNKHRSSSAERSACPASPQRSSYDSAAAAAMAAAAAAAPSGARAAAATVAALELQMSLPSVVDSLESTGSPRPLSPTRQPEECDSPLLSHKLFQQQVHRHGESSLQQTPSTGSTLSAVQEGSSSGAAPAGCGPLIATAEAGAGASPAADREHGPGHGVPEQLAVTPQHAAAGVARSLQGSTLEGALLQTPAAGSGTSPAAAQGNRRPGQQQQVTTPLQGTPYYDCVSKSSPGAAAGNSSAAWVDNGECARAVLMASCPANFFAPRNGIGRSPASSTAGIYQSPPAAVTAAAYAAELSAAAAGADARSGLMTPLAECGSGSPLSLGAGEVFLTPAAAAPAVQPAALSTGSPVRRRADSEALPEDLCSDLSTCDPDMEQYLPVSPGTAAYEQQYGLPAPWAEGGPVQDPHSSSTVVNWDSLGTGQNCSAASSAASSPRLPGLRPLHLSMAGVQPQGSGSSTPRAHSARGPSNLGERSSAEGADRSATAAAAAAAAPSAAGAEAGSSADAPGAEAAANCRSIPQQDGTTGHIGELSVLPPQAGLASAGPMSPSVEAARQILAAKAAVVQAAAGALEAMRHVKGSPGQAGRRSPISSWQFGSVQRDLGGAAGSSVGQPDDAAAAGGPLGLFSRDVDSQSLGSLVQRDETDATAAAAAAAQAPPGGTAVSPVALAGADAETAAADAAAAPGLHMDAADVHDVSADAAALAAAMVGSAQEGGPIEQQLQGERPVLSLPGVDIRVYSSSDEGFVSVFSSAGGHSDSSISLGLPPLDARAAARGTSRLQPVEQQEGVRLHADRDTLDLPDGLSSLGSETGSRQGDFEPPDSLKQQLAHHSCGEAADLDDPAAAAAAAPSWQHRPSLGLMVPRGSTGTAHFLSCSSGDESAAAVSPGGSPPADAAAEAAAAAVPRVPAAAADASDAAGSSDGSQVCLPSCYRPSLELPTRASGARSFSNAEEGLRALEEEQYPRQPQHTTSLSQQPVMPCSSTAVEAAGLAAGTRGEVRPALVRSSEVAVLDLDDGMQQQQGHQQQHREGYQQQYQEEQQHVHPGTPMSAAEQVAAVVAARAAGNAAAAMVCSTFGSLMQSVLLAQPALRGAAAAAEQQELQDQHLLWQEGSDRSSVAVTEGSEQCMGPVEAQEAQEQQQSLSWLGADAVQDAAWLMQASAAGDSSWGAVEEEESVPHLQVQQQDQPGLHRQGTDQVPEEALFAQASAAAAAESSCGVIEEESVPQLQVQQQDQPGLHRQGTDQVPEDALFAQASAAAAESSCGVVEEESVPQLQVQQHDQPGLHRQGTDQVPEDALFAQASAAAAESSCGVVEEESVPQLQQQDESGLHRQGHDDAGAGQGVLLGQLWAQTSGVAGSSSAATAEEQGLPQVQQQQPAVSEAQQAPEQHADAFKQQWQQQQQQSPSDSITIAADTALHSAAGAAAATGQHAEATALEGPVGLSATEADVQPGQSVGEAAMAEAEPHLEQLQATAVLEEQPRQQQEQHPPDAALGQHQQEQELQTASAGVNQPQQAEAAPSSNEAPVSALAETPGALGTPATVTQGAGEEVLLQIPSAITAERQLCQYSLPETLDSPPACNSCEAARSTADAGAAASTCSGAQAADLGQALPGADSKADAAGVADAARGVCATTAAGGTGPLAAAAADRGSWGSGSDNTPTSAAAEFKLQAGAEGEATVVAASGHPSAAAEAGDGAEGAFKAAVSPAGAVAVAVAGQDFLGAGVAAAVGVALVEQPADGASSASGSPQQGAESARGEAAAASEEEAAAGSAGTAAAEEETAAASAAASATGAATDATSAVAAAAVVPAATSAEAGAGAEEEEGLTATAAEATPAAAADGQEASASAALAAARAAASSPLGRAKQYSKSFLKRLKKQKNKAAPAAAAAATSAAATGAALAANAAETGAAAGETATEAGAAPAEGATGADSVHEAAEATFDSARPTDAGIAAAAAAVAPLAASAAGEAAPAAAIVVEAAADAAATDTEAAAAVGQTAGAAGAPGETAAAAAAPVGTEATAAAAAPADTARTAAASAAEAGAGSAQGAASKAVSHTAVLVVPTEAQTAAEAPATHDGTATAEAPAALKQQASSDHLQPQGELPATGLPASPETKARLQVIDGMFQLSGLLLSDTVAAVTGDAVASTAGAATAGAAAGAAVAPAAVAEGDYAAPAATAAAKGTYASAAATAAAAEVGDNTTAAAAASEAAAPAETAVAAAAAPAGIAVAAAEGDAAAVESGLGGFEELPGASTAAAMVAAHASVSAVASAAAAADASVGSDGSAAAEVGTGFASQAVLGEGLGDAASAAQVAAAATGSESAGETAAAPAVLGSTTVAAEEKEAAEGSGQPLPPAVADRDSWGSSDDVEPAAANRESELQEEAEGQAAAAAYAVAAATVAATAAVPAAKGVSYASALLQTQSQGPAATAAPVLAGARAFAVDAAEQANFAGTSRGSVAGPVGQQQDSPPAGDGPHLPHAAGAAAAAEGDTGGAEQAVATDADGAAAPMAAASKQLAVELPEGLHKADGDSDAAAAPAANSTATTAAAMVPAVAAPAGSASQSLSYAAAAAAAAGAAPAAASAGSPSPGSPRRVPQPGQSSGRKDKTLVVQHSNTGGAEDKGSPWAIRAATSQSGRQSAGSSAAGSSRFSTPGAGNSSDGGSSTGANLSSSGAGAFEGSSSSTAGPGRAWELFRASARPAGRLVAAAAPASTAVHTAAGTALVESGSGLGGHAQHARQLLYGVFSSDGGLLAATAAPGKGAVATRVPGQDRVNITSSGDGSHAEMLSLSGAAAAAAAADTSAAAAAVVPTAGEAGAQLAEAGADGSHPTARQSASTGSAGGIDTAGGSSVIGTVSDELSTAAAAAAAAAAAPGEGSVGEEEGSRQQARRRRKQKRNSTGAGAGPAAAVQQTAEQIAEDAIAAAAGQQSRTGTFPSAAATATAQAGPAAGAVAGSSRTRSGRLRARAVGWSWGSGLLLAILALVLTGGALLCVSPGGFTCSPSSFLPQHHQHGSPGTGASGSVWRHAQHTYQKVEGAAAAAQQAAFKAMVDGTATAAARSDRLWEKTQNSVSAAIAAAAAGQQAAFQSVVDGAASAAARSELVWNKAHSTVSAASAAAAAKSQLLLQQAHTATSKTTSVLQQAWQQTYNSGVASATAAVAKSQRLLQHAQTAASAKTAAAASRVQQAWQQTHDGAAAAAAAAAAIKSQQLREKAVGSVMATTATAAVKTHRLWHKAQAAAASAGAAVQQAPSAVWHKIQHALQPAGQGLAAWYGQLQQQHQQQEDSRIPSPRSVTAGDAADPAARPAAAAGDGGSAASLRQHQQDSLAQELQQLLQQHQQELATHEAEEAAAMRKTLRELEARVRRMQERRAAHTAAASPSGSGPISAQGGSEPHLHPQQKHYQGGGPLGPEAFASGGSGSSSSSGSVVIILRELLEANRAVLDAADQQLQEEMAVLLARFQADMQRWQDSQAAAAAVAAAVGGVQDGGAAAVAAGAGDVAGEQQEQQLQDAAAAAEAAVQELVQKLEAQQVDHKADTDLISFLQQQRVGQQEQLQQHGQQDGAHAADADNSYAASDEPEVHDYEDYTERQGQGQGQSSPAVQKHQAAAAAAAGAADGAAEGGVDVMLHLAQTLQVDTDADTELIAFLEGHGQRKARQQQQQGQQQQEQQQQQQPGEVLEGQAAGRDYEPLVHGYYDHYGDSLVGLVQPDHQQEQVQQQGEEVGAMLEPAVQPDAPEGVAGAPEHQEEGLLSGSGAAADQDGSAELGLVQLDQQQQDVLVPAVQPVAPEGVAALSEHQGEGMLLTDSSAAADGDGDNHPRSIVSRGWHALLLLSGKQPSTAISNNGRAEVGPLQLGPKQQQQQQQQDVLVPAVQPDAPEGVSAAPEHQEEGLLLSGPAAAADGDVDGDGRPELGAVQLGPQQQQQQQQDELVPAAQVEAPEGASVAPGQQGEGLLFGRHGAAVLDRVEEQHLTEAQQDQDQQQQLHGVEGATGPAANLSAADAVASGSEPDAAAPAELLAATQQAAAGWDASVPHLDEAGPSQGLSEGSSYGGSVDAAAAADKAAVVDTVPLGSSSRGRMPGGWAAVAAAVALACAACGAAAIGLAMLLSATRQAAGAALGPDTPFIQQQQQPGLDSDWDSDGGGAGEWGDDDLGAEYDTQYGGEIQPFAGYGEDGGATWSEDGEDDASYEPSSGTEGDSPFSYDFSEGDLDAEAGEGSPAAGGSLQLRDSSFAGFQPFPSPPSAGPAAAGGSASAAAAAAGAAGAAAAAAARGVRRYATRSTGGATEFLWLRPNNMVPRNLQGSPGGVDGTSPRRDGGINQRWLRNRVVTSIAGTAAHNPEVVDLVQSQAAVAYCSPGQQRRLSTGGPFTGSPGQQQHSGQSPHQQGYERRPQSASRGDRGGLAAAAGAGGAGGSSPGMTPGRPPSPGSLQYSAGRSAQSPARAGQTVPRLERGGSIAAGGSTPKSPKSPKGLRDDRADIVLGA